MYGNVISQHLSSLMYTYTDPVWCPYLLLPRAALTLKAFLLLQPWSGTFTMDITQVCVLNVIKLHRHHLFNLA